MRSLMLTALLLPGALLAQNGELQFVHGLPSLGFPVDVAINGSTVFSSVDFGDVESTSLPAGSYIVEVSGNGAVLLTGTATIAADGSVAAAAHLLEGGASALSFLDNDLGAVDIAGNSRITVRHLADETAVLFGVSSPSGLILSAAINGISVPVEASPDTYQIEVNPITSTTPFPFPPSALLATGLSVAADEGLEIYIVGTPGNLTAITQTRTLEPAIPVIPSSCDLSLSGSLIGGSASAGGDVIYDLTGAAPDSLVCVFLAFDTTPTTVVNIPLGIGGSGGLGIIGFGLSDANGDFSLTVSYPGVTVTTLPGLPGPITPFTLDYFVQAVSAEALSAGFVATCVSDIEVLQISYP